MRSTCHDTGPWKDASSSYDVDLPGRGTDTDGAQQTGTGGARRS